MFCFVLFFFFFFQAEDGIRDLTVTGVQTCALPISRVGTTPWRRSSERTAASLVETTLPLTFLPVRSVPSHVNGAWVAVAVAILQGLRKKRVCEPIRRPRKSPSPL